MPGKKKRGDHPNRSPKSSTPKPGAPPSEPHSSASKSGSQKGQTLTPAEVLVAQPSRGPGAVPKDKPGKHSTVFETPETTLNSSISSIGEPSFGTPSGANKPLPLSPEESTPEGRGASLGLHPRGPGITSLTPVDPFISPGNWRITNLPHQHLLWALNLLNLLTNLTLPPRPFTSRAWRPPLPYWGAGPQPHWWMWRSFLRRRRLPLPTSPPLILIWSIKTFSKAVMFPFFFQRVLRVREPKPRWTSPRRSSSPWPRQRRWPPRLRLKAPPRHRQFVPHLVVISIQNVSRLFLAPLRTGQFIRGGLSRSPSQSLSKGGACQGIWVRWEARWRIAN